MAKERDSLELLLDQLSVLAEKLAAAKMVENPRAVSKARKTLDELTDRLISIAVGFDPILRPASIFDPADPITAGRIVALTLISQPLHALASIPNFYGAGVYALYYNGGFPAYGALSNSDHPIYVGKADPSLSSAKEAIAQGTKLSIRLNEHAKSIRKAESTLNIDDFKCRFLIVQSGFQKAAEDYLIGFFKPIWNSETKICFGLGKHGDSAETRDNKRSPWDTMHPGRSWADKSSKDQKTTEQIVSQISSHLEKNPPYKDIHQLFERFMGDMRQLSHEEFVDEKDEVVVIEETPGKYSA
ncbi:Eco29kI family restriction endonuclease [Pseudomonas viridiflava]|uniref:Eco29kI family restriction endonuclease n=1 Tax=Pseudomonas viridiflava TaxID=33069 RepID=UPI000F02C11E|nr:Eco29kI family restriction endonuclease [Pseudomonas viridiflava]